MSTGPTDSLGPMTIERVYELLSARLDALETRQRDTTPSWVSMLSDKIDTGFADLRREMRVIVRDLHHVKTDVASLEERVEQIENKH